MLTTMRYILLTARRDWLFPALLGAAFVAMAVADFLGGTAVAEQWQATAAYVAGAVRVIVTAGMVIFVCFHVRRMFENREVEVILTRPISRTSFVIAYWAGFAVVSLGLALPIGAAVGFLLPVNGAGLLAWTASLLLEVWLMTAFALFAALILRSAVAPVILSLAFYAVSRMMGFFLYFFENPRGGSALFTVTENLLQILSHVMPRLDLYAKSSWLIYGVGGEAHMLLFAAQSLITIPLLLTAAIYDFRRKQF